MQEFILDNNLKKYAYIGAIHIHTIYSDGTSDIDKISKYAKSAGLDWIIVTDHNKMAIEEGFINGVYVISAEEISPEFDNHYLALGLSNIVSPLQQIENIVAQVNDNNGFGFAAHPDESDNRKNSFPPIKWTNKNVIPDGVEIWNWFSQWVDNYDEKNIFSNIYGYLFKHELVKAPHKQTLEWWDKLNNNTVKIVPAICGIDVHALKCAKYCFNVEIFPYKELFKTLNNVILLDKPLSENFLESKQQILNAIKNANNIMFNRHVCPKMPFIIMENNTISASCGQSIKLDDKTYLKISSPVKSEISIVKNSIQICKQTAKDCIVKIDDVGKYRVEIKFKNKGYAYSNPIEVY